MGSAIMDMQAECYLFVECIGLLILCNYVILFKFCIMKVLGKETMEFLPLLVKLLQLP